MRKPTLKRLALGLVQQLTAMFLLIAIAAILFNSYLAVDSVSGTKVYDLSPLDAETEFEDSAIFHAIFQNAVSDITRLMVIRGQVETNGKFDPLKKIDITKFTTGKGTGQECNATAVYQLEDLIKWGKYGIEYSNRVMSMSDFVNYFGPADSPENFRLDDSGQLVFAGFLDSEFSPEMRSAGNRKQVSANKEEDGQTEQTLEEKEAVLRILQSYTEEQLEDMAFSYIMAMASSDDISVSREEDGSLSVYYPMISCRYDTVDGEKQLTAYAGNWIDYTKLQSNLVDAITSLADNYQQYQNCNAQYLEGAGNLKYVVRMMTEDGIMHTYTNVPEMESEEDSDITDYFAEYRRYLIYYPDSLEFTGNTSMTEEEIYQYLNEYGYVYPEMTHIWIGVDTNYPVVGDTFYNANAVFQRIVPNIRYIIAFGVILGVIWLFIGVYLTATAGVAYDEEEERVLYLNGIDHVWTEVMILLGAGLLYAGILGYRYLLGVADLVYVSHSEILGQTMTRLSEYGEFGAYGFLTSMFFNMLWYSLVRRIKSHNLWKDSFAHWIFSCCQNGVHFVFSHRNSAISSLLPYNLFLLINLAGMVSIYLLRERRIWFVFPIVALVIIDSVVGVLLFKQKAEQIDIVEGIKRIRDGEVDYKMEIEALHGENREMADAVNNIGEGIRKAVDTSMKDEQMKSDLITNVSHDIKTPLTSIINYVDLLKRLKIEEEPAKSYIAVLDSKSQRLKQLTDDLVEASKISSGNIVLNWETLNLTELLNQAIGEFSDKLEEKKLQVIFDGSEQTAMIYADSRRMWRIIENLFHNICKYALEGTRVYLELAVKEGTIQLSLKNISERPMNIKGDELTERFIRGDASRTTEGSGLGLYIAKNLTKAQKGEFQLQLDGDLFKVVLCFPEFVETEQEKTDEE